MYYTYLQVILCTGAKEWVALYLKEEGQLIIYNLLCTGGKEWVDSYLNVHMLL